MPLGVNRVIIIGFVGQDPYIGGMPSGATVANFQVATTETFRDKQGGPRKSVTEWHRIAAYGATADYVRTHVSKGRQVYVSGSLKTRKYDDKQGITRWVTQIIARDVMLLGGSSDEADAPSLSSEQDIPW